MSRTRPELRPVPKPAPRPIPPPRLAARWRFVRQRDVRQSRSWRPWWLLGLLEVVTHPRPRWWAQETVLLELPAVRAFEDFPARPRRWIVLSVR